MDSVLLATVATLLGLGLGFAVRRRAGFVTEVESVSMAPTLAPGRRLLVRRLRAARPPRRGEIVVVRSVEVGRPVIKRVVGLAGEHLDVDADGRVTIDGDRLSEPYVVRRGGPSGAFDVPDGHVLLLGDNRALSSDARVWRQPYVPVSAVLGRVVRPGWPAPAAERGPGARRSVPAPRGSRPPPGAPRGDG